MFKEGDYVAITGGAWQGHRGFVELTPELRQNEPQAVLVTVERWGEGRAWPSGQPIPEYSQRWVHPRNLAHLDPY